MKKLLFVLGFAAALAASAYNGVTLAAEPVQPARAPETPIRQHAIPAAPAMLVMATTQCNHLVAIVALMPDGMVVGFDKDSKVDYKKQIEWVNTSEHIFVVQAACLVSEDQIGKDL